MIMATSTVNFGLEFFRNHLVWWALTGHRFLSMFVGLYFACSGPRSGWIYLELEGKNNY